MQQRILTGIQSSGSPHLGNVLGAMLPTIDRVHTQDSPSFLFIADLHSLTTQYDAVQRKQDTYRTAAAWLACGIDPKKHLIYRQSRVPQVCELTWYLNCFTPFAMLSNAHAFKDKKTQGLRVNSGLVNYPVLMAADILLYQATHVPVGKDQRQHLEMTRDIAEAFNHLYGEVFVVPEPMINKEVALIQGTDGRKMSKSYGNTLDIFATEERLKQQIMGITTASKSLAEAKDPTSCLVFQLYAQVAPSAEVEQMRAHYLRGNYGYHTAKKELLRLLLARFSEHRARFQHYMKNIDLLEACLAEGEKRAQVIAGRFLDKVRKTLGYR